MPITCYSNANGEPKTTYWMISRTNKNAAISVITGLAVVPVAGRCIAYQD